MTHYLATLGSAIFVAAILGATTVSAHEVRPAYLELTEVSAGRVEVLWKQPILPSADPDLALRLPLEPRFGERCTEVSRALPELAASVLLERWVMTCGETGLQGASVEIIGLPRTLTDVLLRVRWLDSPATDHLLRPEAPRVALSDEASTGLGIPAYLRLGVEHLLFGFDHILFVVGLMFFVSRPRQLVQVVTAFTIAHSITLALSTLGVLTLSQRPVEAVIALSILFLAVELARGSGTNPSPMRRWPWSIAFGFGLLHGFGFAGALSEIGLPVDARAMALFLFNVGVEIGQLLVVGVLLALLWMVRTSRVEPPAFATQIPVYVMGAVSAYWFIDRVIAIL
ncbi:MAG TPA: HupE/UreJ family protein [Acidobacteria bacterium]|nr:HupE/UreJ family protein [Acidobacteriota bacterium]